LLIIIDIGFQG